MCLSPSRLKMLHQKNPLHPPGCILLSGDSSCLLLFHIWHFFLMWYSDFVKQAHYHGNEWISDLVIYVAHAFSGCTFLCSFRILHYWRSIECGMSSTWLFCELYRLWHIIGRNLDGVEITCSFIISYLTSSVQCWMNKENSTHAPTCRFHENRVNLGVTIDMVYSPNKGKCTVRWSSMALPRFSFNEQPLYHDIFALSPWRTTWYISTGSLLGFKFFYDIKISNHFC